MRYTAGLFSATALLALAGAAQAQSISDAQAANNPAGLRREQGPVSVEARAAQNNAPLGILAGAFQLDPSATAALSHVDNVYATDTGEVSDIVGTIRLGLNARSTWSRHALNAFGSVEANRFRDYQTENREDWNLGLAGRLDLGTSTVVNGLVSHTDAQEARTSSASPTIAGEPVEFTLDTITLAAAHNFNRVRVSGVLTNRDYDFDDVRIGGGGVVDQQYRDVTATALRGRLDYGLSPDTSLFLEVSHTIRDYRVLTGGSFNRDGDSTLVLGGANFALTSLVRGEIGVGYLMSNHDDPSRVDVDGFGARAEIEYFPTDVLTLTVQASRAFEDTGIREATGSISTDFDARADYEFRRDLIGTARFGYSVDEYQDIIREDKRMILGLGVAWYFYRATSLNLAYNYIDQDSTGTLGTTGRDFTVNTFSAGVTFRY